MIGMRAVRLQSTLAAGRALEHAGLLRTARRRGADRWSALSFARAAWREDGRVGGAECGDGADAEASG